MKIYTTINEWKESDNYLISKWFHDLKIKIKKIFENEVLEELVFDYFEYDASRMDELYIGQLFFNETEYQYKLTFLIDYAQVAEFGDIESFGIKLDVYSIETDELLGTINREEVQTTELDENFLIELIDDFKTEYIEDKKEIEDL